MLIPNINSSHLKKYITVWVIRDNKVITGACIRGSTPHDRKCLILVFMEAKLYPV